MTHTEIHAEWLKLCEEYEAVRDAHLKAFAAVNTRFREIGEGKSATNPTDGELDDFGKTWSSWENVKRRMDKFVKTHV